LIATMKHRAGRKPDLIMPASDMPSPD